jgi:hypothetical protein
MVFGWMTPASLSRLWAAARVDTGLLYYVGLAVIVAIVLGVLIAAYRTWEEIHDVEEPDSPADLLETFRQAHAEGEIDDHELDRVRRLLTSAEGGAVGESAGNGPPQSAVASDQHPGPKEDAGSVPAEGTGPGPT